MKIVGNSTTSLVCTAFSGSLHNLWCGLLFLSIPKVMRRPNLRIKTISSHTLFFIRFHLGIGGKKCNIMSANYIFDADFAAYLIKKLKEMRKSNGAPFIRHGVTLPYLAYTYKCLNCDSSAITEDYLWNIITSLEKAGSTLFIYQYCSDIEEFVIALFSKQYDDTIKEQGFYTRDSESTILYDSHFFETTPSSKELYERYKDILLKNTFSRVYKEYKYDWGTVSKEDIDAISTIIEEYKSKQCL